MKGALSARRRKEVASKRQGGGRRNAPAGGNHKPDFAGGLSEASIALSGMEAKVGTLARQSSIGARTTFTDISDAHLDTPTSNQSFSYENAHSPPDSPRLPTFPNSNDLHHNGEQPAPDLLCLTASRTRSSQAWENLSAQLLKKGYWSRLGDLAKVLKQLPDDVVAIYERVEASRTTKLDDAAKLQYYKDFIRVALGATSLHIDEVSTHNRNRAARAASGSPARRGPWSP